MATADDRVRRPSLGRAVGLVVLVWAAAAVFVLGVAADTAIGPVVVRITRNHGIHLGDLYALAAAATVALVVTVWTAASYVRRHRRYRRAGGW